MVKAICLFIYLFLEFISVPMWIKNIYNPVVKYSLKYTIWSFLIALLLAYAGGIFDNIMTSLMADVAVAAYFLLWTHSMVQAAKHDGETHYYTYAGLVVNLTITCFVIIGSGCLKNLLILFE